MLTKAVRAFADGDSPSMDEIAAAAGISRAALYELFGSRGAIVEALGIDERPSWRDRILEASAELLAERGLRGLSMDAVASRSGASRATVYRLFPGPAALFREVVHSYLPMEEFVGKLEAMRGQPPAEVLPALISNLVAAGRVRVGVLRSALLEVTGQEEGSEEIAAEVLQQTGAVARYLEDQMAAGHLRPMHPLLAIESLMAPILLHLLSQPLIEAHGLIDVPLDEAVREFTDAWLRAMAPSRSRPSRR